MNKTHPRVRKIGEPKNTWYPKYTHHRHDEQEPSRYNRNVQEIVVKLGELAKTETSVNNDRRTSSTDRPSTNDMIAHPVSKKDTHSIVRYIPLCKSQMRLARVPRIKLLVRVLDFPDTGHNIPAVAPALRTQPGALPWLRHHRCRRRRVRIVVSQRTRHSTRRVDQSHMSAVAKLFS